MDGCHSALPACLPLSVRRSPIPHPPRIIKPPYDLITTQVKEAEQFAEEDKKEKERVDARNHLESLIFQVHIRGVGWYGL